MSIPDSESGDPSSSLGGTSVFIAATYSLHLQTPMQNGIFTIMESAWDWMLTGFQLVWTVFWIGCICYVIMMVSEDARLNPRHHHDSSDDDSDWSDLDSDSD